VFVERMIIVPKHRAPHVFHDLAKLQAADADVYKTSNRIRSIYRSKPETITLLRRAGRGGNLRIIGELLEEEIGRF
jgi:hypothetical protein